MGGVMDPILLKVKDLHVDFDTDYGTICGVDDISFEINAGSTLAIVGESGCGKSVTSLACMHLLGKQGRITRGNIFFEGEDITCAKEKKMRGIRGNEISMIFQEPMTSLNPLLTVGYQISEALYLHTHQTDKDIKVKVLELLQQVGITHSVEEVYKKYPHELSGGQRQRIMIAMALACKPKLLIADEPTTALDVTTQAQILVLLKDLQKKSNMAILLITHDMGIVAEMADEVLVVYEGIVVERGKVLDIFTHAQHPYTRGLIQSIIRIDVPSNRRLYSIPGMVSPIREKWRRCPFYNRCIYATNACNTNLPELKNMGNRHYSRCLLVGKER